MAYKTVITILACGIVLSIIVRVFAPHESGPSFGIPFEWSHPPQSGAAKTPHVAYGTRDNQLWSWIVLGASFGLGWGIALGRLVYCYFCIRHMGAKLPVPPGL